MPKSKTHFPEVPIELAEKIAAQEATNERGKARRGEQLRAAARKRPTGKSSVTPKVEDAKK